MARTTSGTRRGSICHIMVLDKFIPPCIEIIKTELSPTPRDFAAHIFLIFTNEAILAQFPLPDSPNIIILHRRFANKIRRYIFAARAMQNAQKIILHGLWLPYINILLTLMFWALPRCTWAIWGGDLYAHIFDKKDAKYALREVFRRFIIRRFGAIVPVVYGDFDLAKKWYGTRAICLEPFMYAQFYERYAALPLTPQGATINIQVGNSATETNFHAEVFEILRFAAQKVRAAANEALAAGEGVDSARAVANGAAAAAKNAHEFSTQGFAPEFRVFAPLSYGDMGYKNEVITAGRKYFGESFVPLEHFVPFNEYLAFLKSIDIAIFKQNRQQAMGNIFVLLALGKKVYLSPDTTHFAFLREKGFAVFSVEDFDFSPIPKELAMHNKRRILELYSRESQLENQKKIYGIIEGSG